MARALLTAACLVLLLSLGCLVQPVSGTVATLQAYYKYVQSQDQTYFAGNVMTQDTTRLIHESSVALGVQELTNNHLNLVDNAFRMNTVSEVLVVMAALKLVSENVLPSLDTTIPPIYLPRGVSFFNPAATGVQLTLRHLMTHTSTITDSKFESYKTVNPSTVVSLRAFIEAYFLQSSGGKFSVASDVWFSGTPGQAASYRYAKVNIALLAYIVESVVIQQPTLVATGSSQTCAAYIQEKILDPLGMSGTFLRTTNGALPKISYPAGSAFLSGRTVADYTAAGTKTEQSSIHPAYVSDYMYFTTIADMTRLFRSLFLDPKGIFRSIGTMMKDNPFSFQADTTLLDTNVKQQAQGIQFFKGDVICTYGISSNAVTKCPLKETSLVWGSAFAGQYGQTAILCTDAVQSTNPTCVAVALSHYDAGTSRKSTNMLLGMAAVAFQEAIGDSSTVTSERTSNDNSTNLYGLWVFLGLIGTILFVFIASFITENLIQPAPVAAGIPVPTAVNAN